MFVVTGIGALLVWSSSGWTIFLKTLDEIFLCFYRRVVIFDRISHFVFILVRQESFRV